jgi:capsular polysaccharide biosynthesis protein
MSLEPYEPAAREQRLGRRSASRRPYGEPDPRLAPVPPSRNEPGMELNEAGRRIFGQHWRLILGLMLAGIAVAALLHGGSVSTYTASTRLVLDNQDPKSRAESTSIADTAKAIATSPSQVRGALKDAHVTGRDPIDLAKHHVSIGALGTSAVLQLSVSDRNPRVAAAVATTLASRVIRARLDVSNGKLQQVLGQLEQRVDGLNRRIAAVDSPTLRASLGQQRSVLEAERVSLLSTEALRPKPSIISPATLPTHADSSGWVPYLVLGALLGLVLGVGAAGLLETVRPTLVGSNSLARAFETPLLGSLPSEPNEHAADALRRITPRLFFAAEAAGVGTVNLLATDPDVDLSRLAHGLEAAPADAFAPPRSPTETHSWLRIRPFNLRDSSREVPGGVGLVVVSPTALKKTQLIDVSHLLSVASLPLLGLLTYNPSPSRRRQAMKNRVASPARYASVVLLLVSITVLILYVVAH